MEKKSEMPALPVAELLIRIGDTRPVVITMASDFHSTGTITISFGTWEDMRLAEWVLDFMRNAVADEDIARMRKALNDLVGSSEDESVDTDSPPF